MVAGVRTVKQKKLLIIVCQMFKECCLIHACFIIMRFIITPADAFQGCFSHAWVESQAVSPLISSPTISLLFIFSLSAKYLTVFSTALFSTEKHVA